MSASLDGAFDACLQAALEQSRVLIPNWLSALSNALQQRESAGGNLNETLVYRNARIVLANYQDRIATRFIDELREAVRDAIAPERPARGTRRLQYLSLDDLELMDHGQVQETVDMARVQQIVRMATDDAVVALNARMSSARGFDVVRPDVNPLRPDVIVSALMRALSGLHIDDAVRTRWLQTGAVPLGHALQCLYVSLTGLLDGLGVHPAGYVVVQARSPPPAAGDPSAAARMDSAPPMAPQPGQNSVLTLDHLRQLLVGNLERDGASGSGNAMVRTLAAEVVTFVLRRIAEDQRLLAPVRDMILSLKPAFLQLASTDPRFFADRENAGRRLLDLIISQSLAFTSEQDRGFAVFAERINRIAISLKAANDDLPERIDDALQKLLDHASNRPSPKQGLAMQTLFKVEQRNLLADRVAIEIQARNDFSRAPGVVRRFLEGPWAQVVAQARLEMSEGNSIRGTASAHRFMDVVPELLWSSQLSLASRNRPRLVRVIPGVLRTLREGLDFIDYPPERSETFFQALMGLHEAACKTPLTDAFEGSNGPESRHMVEDSGPWLHHSEVQESGFLDDLHIASQPAFLDTVPMNFDSLPPAHVVDAPAGCDLAVGAWVDLLEEQGTVRCQLTWASPHSTLFLFTGPERRPISLTRRGLERLQSLGRLTVVAEHGLVNDALDAVAQQALINSGQA